MARFAAVMTAIQSLEKTLSPNNADLSNGRSCATRRSAGPIFPSASCQRKGLRLGDLDEKQAHAARGVAAAALSACGLKMLDDIRVADTS